MSMSNELDQLIKIKQFMRSFNLSDNQVCQSVRQEIHTSENLHL